MLLDADVLPIRCYDHLFLLSTPAGIINEREDLFKRTNRSRRYVAVGRLDHGRWQWHDHYRAIPHGERIPARITDRVLGDPTNLGVNAALLVLEPNINEYRAVVELLGSGVGPAARLADYRWPDMQFLTAFWSGRWHNVDLCFAGLSGYPELALLFGTHFAGPKPWAIRNPTVHSRFRRFPDFRRWYEEYVEMVNANPELRSQARLAGLEEFARRAVLGRFDPTRCDS
ncbi:MAG: hypothetical protein ACOC1I_04925 [Spirochaetota bacterium]